MKFDLKKIDKKVWIGIAAAIVCIVVIVVIAVAAGGSGKQTGDTPTDADKTADLGDLNDSESQTDEENQKDTDTQLTTAAEEQSNAETQKETGTQQTSTSETKTENTQTSVSGDGNTETTKATGSSSGNQTTTTPTQSQTQKPTQSQTTQQTSAAAGGEAGTSHLEFPGEDFSVTTVEIAAGKSVYYDIYRVGGMILKIKDANAYVVHGGKKYTAQNGVVTVQVEQALASDSVAFEIGNSGSSKKSFRLEFSYPVGTYGNPEKLSSIGGTFKTYSPEDNEVGYHYTYVAEKTGTIVFYITNVECSKNVSAGISVTNNNTYANRTTSADGVTDGQGYARIEMDVTKGDELRIEVAVSPTATWKYPEATITWVAEYK